MAGDGRWGGLFTILKKKNVQEEIAKYSSRNKKFKATYIHTHINLSDRCQGLL
jgi:predicted SpoU family rRNA methylase